MKNKQVRKIGSHKSKIKSNFTSDFRFMTSSFQSHFLKKQAKIKQFDNILGAGLCGIFIMAAIAVILTPDSPPCAIKEVGRSPEGHFFRIDNPNEYMPLVFVGNQAITPSNSEEIKRYIALSVPMLWFNQVSTWVYGFPEAAIGDDLESRITIHKSICVDEKLGIKNE